MRNQEIRKRLWTFLFATATALCSSPSLAAQVDWRTEQDHTGTSGGSFGTSLAALDSTAKNGGNPSVNPVMIVGAAFDTGPDDECAAGAVFLVEFGTGAIHGPPLVAPAPVPNALFGWSVGRIDNLDTAKQNSDPDIIVGAPGEAVTVGGTTFASAGAVYLFSSDTGALIRRIPNPTPQTNAQFGASVASALGDIEMDLSPTDFIVGAPGQSSGLLTRNGSAFVLSSTAANPVLAEHRGSASMERLGHSVQPTLDRDPFLFLAGAPAASVSGVANRGRVDLVRYNPGATPTIVRSYTSGSTVAGRFGESIASPVLLYVGEALELFVVSQPGNNRLYGYETSSTALRWSIGFPGGDVSQRMPVKTGLSFAGLMVGTPVNDTAHYVLPDQSQGESIRTFFSPIDDGLQRTDPDSCVFSPFQNYGYDVVLGSGGVGISNAFLDSLSTEVLATSRRSYVDAGMVLLYQSNGGLLAQVNGRNSRAKYGASVAGRASNGFSDGSPQNPPIVPGRITFGAPLVNNFRNGEIVPQCEVGAAFVTNGEPYTHIQPSTAEIDAGARYGTSMEWALGVRDEEGMFSEALLVGAPLSQAGEGRAHLRDALCERVDTVLQAPVPQPGARYGSSVAYLGDVGSGLGPRDGVIDFAVGEPRRTYPGGPLREGTVYVHSGGDPGFPVIATLRGVDYGYGANEEFGYALAGLLADIDGFGVPDFVVGSPFADPGGVADAGSACVIRGEDMSLLFRVDGTFSGEALGADVARVGDVTLDGSPEILIGSPGKFAMVGPVFSLRSGEALLYGFGAGSPVLLATIPNPAPEANARFGEAVSGWSGLFGIAVPSGVIPQIAIGAPRADVLVPGDDRGRVWVFGWDPATGSVRNALTRSLDPTPLPGIDEYLTNAFQDEAGPGDRFGASVDFTGNFDGLGFEDVAVGAPKVDALDDGQGNPIENNGRGYVFTMFPTSK